MEENQHFSDSVAVEFLGLFLAEREQGKQRSLSEYMALFPGYEEFVAREYVGVTDPSAFASSSDALDPVQYEPAHANFAPEGLPSFERATGNNEPDSTGETVGEYRLVRTLGRGGQGTVWLALDSRLERQVALKLVPRSPLFEDVAPRLRREARALSQMDHPGICSVYEVGADKDYAWIAMQYVEGETLTQCLEAKGLDTTGILRCLEDVARAVHAAHERGLVHRDLKPGNIVITPDNRSLILDFGIALDEQAGPRLTQSGQSLGTPEYMSPEQMEGAAVDRRTDIWSLGVTLFEALLGKRPFDGPTRATVMQSVLNEAPRWPSRPALLTAPQKHSKAVLEMALAKDSNDRYQTALEFAEDLARLRTGQPVKAQSVGPLQRLWMWAKRHPALAASLGGLLLVLTAGLLTTSLLLRRTNSLFADFRRVADRHRVQQLIQHVDTLHPVVPELVDEIDQWLNDSSELLARRELHERALEQSLLPQEPSSVQREEKSWMADQLGGLLEELDELLGLQEHMQQRRDFAKSIAERSINEVADLWSSVQLELSHDARFAGFQMEPLLGFLPLGTDPQSGLQEFAHLQSGRVPHRLTDGTLEVDETVCMVFVLLPGGKQTLGAPDKDAPEIYMQAHDVELAPFLISKYEQTQGQWQRHTRSNPSWYGIQDPGHVLTEQLRHPVENFSCQEAQVVLGQMQLSLPSESQWEYAAIGEDHFIYVHSNDPYELEPFENFADKALSELRQKEDQYEDGFALHAPVGSFLPNSFGLHDVMGNVMELCADSYLAYPNVPARSLDGLRKLSPLNPRPARGGSFLTKPGSLIVLARSAFAPNLRVNYLGLRPVKNLAALPE